MGRSFVLLLKSYWIFLFVMLILEMSILMLVQLSNMGTDSVKPKASLRPPAARLAAT